MVEPLLHFVVPFVSFRAAGVDWRKALFASCVALTPDLDVLLHAHRSMSHSLLVLGLVALPIIALTYKKKSINNLVILAVIGVITHLTLDLFTGYTPILWPLLNDSFLISTSLDMQFGSPPFFIASAKLLVKPTIFAYFQSLLAPLITAGGFGISIVLLTPICLTAFKQYLSGNRKPDL